MTINFEDFVTPTIIITDNGERKNIRDVPDKSIETEFAAKKMLTENEIYHIHTDLARVLSDKMLLSVLVHYQEQLVNDWAQSNNELWAISYDKAFAFYFDSVTERFADVFAKFDVSTEYINKSAFHAYMARYRTDPSVTINDITLTDISQIKAAIQNSNMITDVRANSAGFSTLIPLYPIDLFIEHIANCALNAQYGAKSNFTWLIFEFLERFTGNVSSNFKTKTEMVKFRKELENVPF